jgi:hypothetical protein
MGRGTAWENYALDNAFALIEGHPIYSWRKMWATLPSPEVTHGG